MIVGSTRVVGGILRDDPIAVDAPNLGVELISSWLLADAITRRALRRGLRCFAGQGELSFTSADGFICNTHRAQRNDPLTVAARNDHKLAAVPRA